MNKQQVVPLFYAVDASDIAALCQVTSVHESLVDFWRSKGSADYNRDVDGATIEPLITNQVLGPDEVIELIAEPTYDTEAIIKLGVPFFVKLDREFVAITDTGEVVQAKPDGSPLVLAASLSEFLDKVTERPLFYDDYLPPGDFLPD
ncbi:hypothetical protein [Rhizobium sp. MHM7A]|uniref:hypothetical protein n=1 Tax=Rhizobium sp. MHM7A TaxID=2583233 RepID=UPI00110659D9|nr:hypothetical protein [Rhizobium sp. MHM7A]TLX17117.1 hypothetical protein FFR93_07340 [Rhizobium sp. MHM7A]